MEIVKENKEDRVIGFYEALSGAMSEIPMFEKKNKVSYGKGKTSYSYIKLEEINAVIKPILKKHDLFITHKVENGFLVTSLVHIHTKDGVSSYFKIDSSDPQKIGSLMTYGRRYNTCAILNIDCAGEDDDCVKLYNDSQKPEPTKEEIIKKVAAWVEKQTDERTEKFWDYLKSKYNTEVLTEMNMECLKEIFTMIK